MIIDTIVYGYALHFIYGCGIHFLAAIWCSVTCFLLHLSKPIKTDQANQNEEQQQMETFPTTEEPRSISPLTPEDDRPAHKVPRTISMMDEVESYNENC
jgi:hypothetical protein